eukprot:TRINITY_DN59634_c0_g1_i1.p1 TRINITY_DN59634_c0_g1~~TRINITY_DN59634_c0_g1_i1.p1  ORF type:complete len:488 (+),score=121.82 TRINITY_DN59634_c0_g1_i1:77-1465(+)
MRRWRQNSLKQPSSKEMKQPAGKSLPADAAEGRPLLQLVAKAVQTGSTLCIGNDVADDSPIPVLGNLNIEGQSEDPLPPTLRTPGLVVANEASLTLSDLVLDGVQLELRKGTSCQLLRCHLRGGGIKVGEGASLRLEHSSIRRAPAAGVAAAAFKDIVVKASTISACGTHGLQFGPGGFVSVTDCLLSDNQMNGVIVEGAGDNWKFEGCTLSGNHQYGIWVDSAATTITWGQNSLPDNALGEKGGRGELPDWQAGVAFRVGSECLAWSEAHAAWLPGKVWIITSTEKLTVMARAPILKASTSSKKDTAKASAAPPLRRVRSKTSPAALEAAADSRVALALEALPDGETWLRLSLPPDGVRQPRSGANAEAPKWSEKAELLRRKRGAVELFIRESGLDEEAFRQLPEKDRRKFQTRVRQEHLKKEVKEEKASKKRLAGAIKSGLLGQLSRKRSRSSSQVSLLL